MTLFFSTESGFIIKYDQYAVRRYSHGAEQTIYIFGQIIIIIITMVWVIYMVFANFPLCLLGGDCSLLSLAGAKPCSFPFLWNASQVFGHWNIN